MDSHLIRVGRPLIQWLEDSDAGTYFREVDAAIPAPHRTPRPHNEELMDVLAKIDYADPRADGSVRIEVIGRDEAGELHDWVSHIAWISRQNAGEDATERGRYNSARATLRALEKHFGRL